MILLKIWFFLGNNVSGALSVSGQPGKDEKARGKGNLVIMGTEPNFLGGGAKPEKIISAFMNQYPSMKKIIIMIKNCRKMPMATKRISEFKNDWRYWITDVGRNLASSILLNLEPLGPKIKLKWFLCRFFGASCSTQAWKKNNHFSGPPKTCNKLAFDVTPGNFIFFCTIQPGGELLSYHLSATDARTLKKNGTRPKSMGNHPKLSFWMTKILTSGVETPLPPLRPQRNADLLCELRAELRPESEGLVFFKTSFRQFFLPIWTKNPHFFTQFSKYLENQTQPKKGPKITRWNP